jgi:hypothetical protein
MAKPYRRTVPWVQGTDGTCEVCGKQRYRSRKVARRAARHYPELKLRAYEPDHALGWWHLGTVPPELIEGKISRDQINDGGRLKRMGKNLGESALT